MSGGPKTRVGPHGRRALVSAGGPNWFLVGIAVAFVGLFIVAPLSTVFVSALSKGVEYFLHSLTLPDSLSAIRLTLLTAAIAVPMNTAFGVAAAWAISKYDFRGKSLLTTLIDLPFSVSPVISGLVFILLFGARGVFGPWLREHDIRIVFAVPGIVLATTFVTFPLVAREVLAVMQAHGSDEEEAALTMGAGGFKIFTSITLRKIRWGIIYGMILCNARAMGEFGAVSVVSGHIRGETNTLPLQIEVLYNEYQFASAFALASLLAMLALVTLAIKTVALISERASVAQAQREATIVPTITAEGGAVGSAS